MDFKKNIHHVFFLFFLFILNVLAYHNAIHNDFRYDQPEVYQGAEIPRFEDRLKYAFTLKTPDPSIAPNLLWFRPAAFVLSWQLFLLSQKQPYVINLFNILFLTITGFSLFLLIRYLSGSRLLAFLASALFCMHPVNGVWVYYTPGGVHGFVVLSFMLLSFYYFMVFVKDQRNRVLLGMSLLFLGFGLLFHEIACFLPLYMALGIHLVIKKDLLKAYLYLIPFGVVIIGYLLPRSAMLGSKSIMGHVYQGFDADLWLYGLTLIKVFLIFLSKLVTLKGIVINWCEPLIRSFSLFWALIGGALVGAFIYLLMRGRGIAAWAISLIFAGFLPVCMGGTSALKEGVIYEGHWMFFTTIGFCVLLAWMLSAIFHRWRRWGTALMIMVVFSWMMVGGMYNQLYADELAYALYYRQFAPGFRMAKIFVHEAYFKRGQFDEAREAIRESLTGTINDSGIYQRLAYMDFLEVKYGQAEENLKTALSINPENFEAVVLLGHIYVDKSEYLKAIELYQTILKKYPSFKKAWHELADVYEAAGQTEEAQKIWERFPVK